MVSERNQIAKKYCDKNLDWPTRTIAKQLRKDRPDLYPSLESARGCVRYWRAEKGEMSRKRVGKNKVETTKFSAPPSDSRPFAPYVFNFTGSGAIISDIHVPYHDRKALDLAIEHLIKSNCTDYLVILGDAIDFYQISKFGRDPRARSVPQEVEMLRGILGDLTGIFKSVIYKAGNHEARWRDYMRSHAPHLLGMPEFEIEKVFRLEKLGIDWVDWYNVIYVGDHFTMVHGHEFGGSVFSPVSPARGLFLRTKACSMCGHHHQTSQNDEPNVRGKALTTWSLGCLCDLHPEYLPFNKWNHGFAEFSTNGGNDWSIINRRIVGGIVR